MVIRDCVPFRHILNHFYGCHPSLQAYDPEERSQIQTMSSKLDESLPNWLD